MFQVLSHISPQFVRCNYSSTEVFYNSIQNFKVILRFQSSSRISKHFLNLEELKEILAVIHWKVFPVLLTFARAYRLKCFKLFSFSNFLTFIRHSFKCFC